VTNDLETKRLEAEVESLRQELKREKDRVEWVNKFAVGWEVRAVAAERRIAELTDLFVALDLDPLPRPSV
jgi:hypothetical protein